VIVFKNFRINEYKCSTGECIPLEKLCDGNADCKENSDETNICDKVTACPPSTHRCKVGSCVYLSQRCDGRRDCIDGSDESELLCKNLECREGECQNKGTRVILRLLKVFNISDPNKVHIYTGVPKKEDESITPLLFIGEF
jgi:hypothetical protein